MKIIVIFPQTLDSYEPLHNFNQEDISDEINHEERNFSDEFPYQDQDENIPSVNYESLETNAGKQPIEDMIELEIFPIETIFISSMFLLVLLDQNSLPLS